MRAVVAAIVAAAVVLGPGVGMCGERFERALAEARRGLAARDAALTLGALRRAMAIAWAQLPFTAIDVRLAQDLPTGYGLFRVRRSNVFRPSEPLFLYMEPVGFTVRRDPRTGFYFYHLVADFNLVDSSGRVVGGRREVAHFKGTSRYFPDRLPVSFTYSLKGLPPGSYTVETVLRDLLSGRSHTVVTKIRVVKP